MTPNTGVLKAGLGYFFHFNFANLKDRYSKSKFQENLKLKTHCVRRNEVKEENSKLFSLLTSGNLAQRNLQIINTYRPGKDLPVAVEDEHGGCGIDAVILSCF